MSKAVIRCFKPDDDEIGRHRLFKAVDFEVAHSSLEQAFGVKLDKRKNYAVIRGVLCEDASWTRACSGCTPEYEAIGYCPDQGGGCEECGYTGRRRDGMWVPHNIDAIKECDI